MNNVNTVDFVNTGDTNKYLNNISIRVKEKKLVGPSQNRASRFKIYFMLRQQRFYVIDIIRFKCKVVDRRKKFSEMFDAISLKC